jgi:hypothetical protein
MFDISNIDSIRETMQQTNSQKNDITYRNHFKQAQESLGLGDSKKAYEQGVLCRSILQRSFMESGLDGKIVNLDRFVETSFLLKECSELQNCLTCSEKYLTQSYCSLLKIYYSEDFDMALRQKARDCIKLIFQEAELFYQKHDMKDKLGHMRARFKQDYYQLLTC